MIQVLLWLPIAAALLACLAPKRIAPWVATAGALGTLVLAALLVFDFDSSVAGIQHAVDEAWIPDLGVRYSLGVDGISLFLVLLTAVAWFAATAWSAIRMPERAKPYFLMLGIAETATLGAFLAQDLLLFVLFFDLMLIPFYFLFGSWGSAHPGRDWEGKISPTPATIKMVVYTLVGSLLMLAGAIAAGVIAGDGGTPVFSMAELRANPLDYDSQIWIFCFFAAAFLVKMPAFLVHGWMPDAYRVAPLAVLAVFASVLSKVAAYGFLRVVLPIFPDATIELQEVMLVIALASILYGSVMAFTQNSARLVAGYSSVAQLGFITLGIFALRPDGADGAVLQMVNHGLVIVPLMLIFVVLAERAGTDDITRMGGIAFRAPGDGDPVPGRDDGAAGDARLLQLRRRVLHPQRRLPGEGRVRPGRLDRDRDGRLLRAAPVPARDAQPQAGRSGVEGDPACARARSSAPWSPASWRWRSIRS